MTLYVQIFAVLAILIIGYLVFRFAPLAFKTKVLVWVSLFTLVSVILAIFSWMVPVFGFPALKIGFSQLPLMLAGALFGPAWAFLAGLASDILELLSGTISFPFFGFTLNKILIALIPALVFRFRDRLKARYLSTVLLIVIGLASCLYTLSLTTLTIQESQIDVTAWMKGSAIGLVVILVGVLIALLNKIKMRFLEADAEVWILSVILVEVIVNLIFTPIWLQAMYGLPVLVSISARLLKAVVMILLNSLIGLFSLRVLKRLSAT